MKKIKLFLCVALFGAMSYGAFTAYDYVTMSEEERFLLANIEALTTTEPGGGDYGDALIENCKWSSNKQCDFMYQGQMWTNSNMIKR